MNSDTNSRHGGLTSPEAEKQLCGSQQGYAQSFLSIRGLLCSRFPELDCCLNYKATLLRCPVLSASYRFHTGMCVASLRGTEELEYGIPTRVLSTPLVLDGT